MIIQGDAMQLPLADKSVQCVVTSPPYWGLRDYGTATWVGGDHLRDGTNMIECDHKPPASRKGDYPGSQRKQQTNSGSFGYREWQECGNCGATRIDSQIGLESTPEEYVAKIVAVFAEVWRVLRDDGTCWVNLGDSYAGHNLPGWRDGNEVKNGGVSNKNGVGYVPGLKPKDLCGVPWRVAFALQAEGWYLRSDIIWSKPNPMPESVTDRPTKAHEYIFMLSKKERYFFDQDAVREPALQPFGLAQLTGQHKADADGFTTNGHGNSTLGTNQGNAGRNIRTVWEIATQPYPEAHFATFPEEIAKRCILAGSKQGSMILDPFCGSGTVVQVAKDLGRIGIGVDVKLEYLKMARRRSAQLGFGHVFGNNGMATDEVAAAG